MYMTDGRDASSPTMSAQQLPPELSKTTNNGKCSMKRSTMWLLGGMCLLTIVLQPALGALTPNGLTIDPGDWPADPRPTHPKITVQSSKLNDYNSHVDGHARPCAEIDCACHGELHNRHVTALGHGAVIANEGMDAKDL